jgi:pimeloyl-ACP methyl ester carboxylesterase
MMAVTARNARGAVAGVALATMLALGIMAPVAAQPATGAGGAGASASAPAQLARGAWLGAQLGPGEGGVAVMSVMPGGTAAAAGVAQGDVITAIDGSPTPAVPAVLALLRQKQAGGQARIRVVRAGAARELSATYAGRPVERFEGARVTQGAVAFGGGLLRDVLVMPDRPAPGSPVVFFLPGVTCMSIESQGPGAYPIGAMIQGLVARGIGFYRVEKAGQGDSRGPVSCAESDFAQEVAGFRAGYDRLTGALGVSPARITLFGHSMGGIQAPALVVGGAPVGRMATFGTAVTPWQDYLIDLFRWQPVLQGEQPAVADEFAEQMRPVIEGLMGDPGGAAAVAARSPQAAALMREHMAWDGADSWMGRISAYWRGVNTARPIQLWSQVRVPVLVLHGEKDLAVVDHRDEQRIAAIVNAYAPGSARFVSLPDTKHDLSLAGTGGFNPRIVTELADWMLGAAPAAR